MYTRSINIYDADNSWKVLWWQQRGRDPSRELLRFLNW